MAAGDIVFFDQWLADVSTKKHDHSADDFRMGVITAAVTPAATDADPRWGAGGTTNYASNEVAAGGNYSAGGPQLLNPTVVLGSGAAVWDADDISIAKDASNPTNGRWGIIYNNTDAGKRAVGYVDLGAVVDMTAGNFSCAWNANGISELDQAA